DRRDVSDFVDPRMGRMPMRGPDLMHLVPQRFQEALDVRLCGIRMANDQRAALWNQGLGSAPTVGRHLRHDEIRELTLTKRELAVRELLSVRQDVANLVELDLEPFGLPARSVLSKGKRSGDREGGKGSEALDRSQLTSPKQATSIFAQRLHGVQSCTPPTS